MYYTLDPAETSLSFESRLNNGQSWAAYIACFDNVVQQAPPVETETAGVPTDLIATDHESDMAFAFVGRFRNSGHTEPTYTPTGDMTEEAEVISPGDAFSAPSEVRFASGWDRGEPAPGGNTTVGWDESSSHVMHTVQLKAVPQRNNAILILSMLPGLLVPAGAGKLLIPQMLDMWKELF
jgi:hypothetical protein